jgi:hypothetical protein
MDIQPWQILNISAVISHQTWWVVFACTWWPVLEGHIPTFAGKSALNPSEIPKSGQQTSKCLPVKSTMGFFENSVPLNPLTPKCLRNVQRQAMVCWRGWSHG